jgi:hypothetical protein
MLNHPMFIRESLVGFQGNVILEEETVPGVGAIRWTRPYGYCAGCINGPDRPDFRPVSAVEVVPFDHRKSDARTLEGDRVGGTWGLY